MSTTYVKDGSGFLKFKDVFKEIYLATGQFFVADRARICYQVDLIKQRLPPVRIDLCHALYLIHQISPKAEKPITYH